MLSGKLRRAAPALRKTGIHIAFERGGHASTRTIRIEARAQPEQAGKPSSASSASSATGQKPNKNGGLSADDPDDLPTMRRRSADDATVGANSLKNNETDDAADADDVLHLHSGVSDIAAVFEELAAQANPDCGYCGRPGTPAKPLRLAGDGVRMAYLHRACEARWAEGGLTLGSSH